MSDDVDEVARLRAENDRLRGEVDQACAMFSKFAWTGRLGMPREFHVARGRRMAGLREEGDGPPCSVPGGAG